MTKQGYMTKHEFMAMSLPYDLQVVNEKGVRKTYAAVHYSYEFEPDFEKFTPILRPLSDLTKEIEHKGEKFVPIVKLLENSSFDTSKMSEEEIMYFVNGYSYIDLIALYDLPLYLQWHFDLFGGIESGEAIDVNTLDINPYK